MTATSDHHKPHHENVHLHLHSHLQPHHEKHDDDQQHKNDTKEQQQQQQQQQQHPVPHKPKKILPLHKAIRAVKQETNFLSKLTSNLSDHGSRRDRSSDDAPNETHADDKTRGKSTANAIAKEIMSNTALRTGEAAAERQSSVDTVVDSTSDSDVGHGETRSDGKAPRVRAEESSSALPPTTTTQHDANSHGPSEPTSTPQPKRSYPTKKEEEDEEEETNRARIYFALISLAIITIHRSWHHRKAICSNQIPLSVSLLWTMTSYLLGNLLASLRRRAIHFARESSASVLHSRMENARNNYDATHGTIIMSPTSPNANTILPQRPSKNNYEDNGDYTRFQRTKELVRRLPLGYLRLQKLTGIGYTSHDTSDDEREESSTTNTEKKRSNTATTTTAINAINTTKAIKGIVGGKAFWTTLEKKAPSAPHFEIHKSFMNHLLMNPDFSRTKRKKCDGGRHHHHHHYQKQHGYGDNGVPEESTEKGNGQLFEVEATVDVERRDEGSFAELGKKETAIGKAKLNNILASKLIKDESFAYIVEPMCKLRGMDLFLTTNAEEEIWRQPMLNECGLRDVPTFIGNMLLPFGNITVYFRLPGWFDDWNNIPEENDDDSPDVKAMKRFLSGDEDYRNKRLKIVPFLVDGPLAIRLIKPKPVEITIHGERHPSKWARLPKTTNASGKTTTSALLECDVDLVSNAAVRKIINIVRPHLKNITIDLAMVVSKPYGSDVEEPSACLGLWRIEKVDFERCAVIPAKSIEEVAVEVKKAMLMSGLQLVADDQRALLEIAA